MPVLEINTSSPFLSWSVLLFPILISNFSESIVRLFGHKLWSLLKHRKPANANKQADVRRTLAKVWFLMVSSVMAVSISMLKGAFLLAGFARVFRKPSRTTAIKD